MKNLFSFLLVCVLIMQAGCSSFSGNVREPAQAENDLLKRIFTITTMETNALDQSELVKQRLNSPYYGKKLSTVEVEMVPSKTLGKGVAYYVELDVNQKKGTLVYRVFHSPTAFKDSIASNAVISFVEKLKSAYEFSEAIQAPFELYFNAKAGNPFALEALAKLKESSISELADPGSAALAKSDLSDVKEEIKQEVKTFKAQVAKEESKRKVGLDALDKAPEGKQFRTMIAKGDREGAAAVLKKYLPWEDMAPFEKQFWETYIEVMKKPVPLSERVIIYRGLDEDYINKAIVKGKELTEKEAIQQDKAFVMSSMMIKNQGTWNRRLRSLEAMNGKFIATIDGKDEYAKVARITTMFYNHSQEPKGSPFLSFSPNYNIANSFGSQRVSAYLFDPRLLNFNYASTFDNEIEYLVPLTTFPDELIAIADTELMEANPQHVVDRQAYLAKKLDELIEREYGTAKKKEIVEKIKKNTYQFFKGDYAQMHDPAGKNPGASNLTFYKKFYTKDDPKPVLSPTGELNCKDLIELFWAAK